MDGVKDNVDKLTSLFNFFNKIWDEGCAEWWVDQKQDATRCSWRVE